MVKSERNNNEYHLSYISKDIISNEIKDDIKLSEIASPQRFNKVHIPQRELDKIKEMVLADDRKTAIIAMKKYFDTNFTEVILDSFEKKENF